MPLPIRRAKRNVGSRERPEGSLRPLVARRSGRAGGPTPEEGPGAGGGGSGRTARDRLVAVRVALPRRLSPGPRAPPGAVRGSGALAGAFAEGPVAPATLAPRTSS